MTKSSFDLHARVTVGLLNCSVRYHRIARPRCATPVADGFTTSCKE